MYAHKLECRVVHAEQPNHLLVERLSLKRTSDPARKGRGHHHRCCRGNNFPRTFYPRPRRGSATATVISCDGKPMHRKEVGMKIRLAALASTLMAVFYTAGAHIKG